MNRRLLRACALTTAMLGWAVNPVRAQEGTAAPPAGDEGSARVEEVAGRIEGLDEQVQTLQSDTDKLKKFKFSGYVQARWEAAENQADSVQVSGSPAALTPANRERFFIRRARLKLTYDSSPSSQAVVYLDGGADRTIRLLEAYVSLLDPWTPDHRHGLTVGQFNVPFGYEIERSSSVRELPERSRAENVLFGGERDRGVKLVSRWSPRLETVVGLLNGGGINHPDFPNADPTQNKDWLARARWSQGTFDVAASYYDGHDLVPLTGPDVQTRKTRLGLDAQGFYELPVLGGGSLRGEFYAGKNVNADSVSVLVAAPSSSNPSRLLEAGADPAHLATDFRGGYVMWVQSLGEKLQVAARYDAFDPNSDREHDQFERVGVGLNWFHDGFTRVSVAYDIPRTDVAAAGGGFTDPKDNAWTVQVQHKF